MATWRDYLELHFIVLLWGFTAVLGKLISIPPVELVFYRTLLAGGLLGVWIFWQKLPLNMDARSKWQLLGNGVLIGIHWITFFASARISNVSVSLAGFATIALWTSLLEPLVMRRSFRWYELLLGLITMAGLYIIMRFEVDHAIGLMVGVVSAFFGALFTVINAKFTHRYNHYSITFYEMLGATLAIALFFPWYGPLKGGLQMLPTLTDWFYIFVLAAVCTVYAYSISVKLMKRITAFAVNLTVNLEPVYGIILGLIILGQDERMTTAFYVGSVIILLAVLSYPVLNRIYDRGGNIA